MRAERVARELGALFEKTRAPVLAVERSGEFVAANGAMLAKYGYSLEELLSMRVQDLQAYGRDVDADLGRAQRGEELDLERRPHRTKDGAIVWVVPTAGPVEVDGSVLVVSVLNDVTAMVTAEERLELVWQEAVDHMGSALALLDRHRRIVRVNRVFSQLIQREPKDVVGARCVELFPSCRSARRCPHQVAVAESRRVVQELVSAAGKALRVEVWPAQRNDIGVATVHVATDLTEERAARSQLVTADRLATIGRLAAGVAHDVNNPAGFVTLALQLVKDQLANDKGRLPDILLMLDEAIGAMLQINQTMRDLTGFSRERARTPTELSQIAQSALRLAAHETHDRATLDRVFDEGLYANVRGARIAQVVLNLVVNAAQAIPPGNAEANRIEVRVSGEGDTVSIDVTDTGPGVPAAIGDRIFEPFFTTRESTGGTGLGLWLSRSIIEEEGGTLTYRNVPGGGARFSIRLPAYRLGGQAEAHPQP